MSSSDKFSYSSDSEDDDAPGEISSSAVRNTKLSQVRSDRQIDKEAKEKERDKRRHRNEMFTSQKKQKLETFGDRALPEDILEAVSAKQNKLDEEEFSNVNDEDDSGEDSDEGAGSDSDEDDDEDDDDDENDFIAFDSSAKENSLNVVTVQESKKNTSSLEKALAFRNTRLFSGSEAPHRCSANKRKGLMEKKKMLHAK